MKLLSRKEEMLLLTIWRLRNNAYGVTIKACIYKETNKDWSIGAVYDVLDRLKRNGYVSTRTGEPVPERGGKRIRYYMVTKKGYSALMELKALEQKIWDNLPEIILG